MLKIREIPFEDAVAALGCEPDTLLMIERHDDALWLLVERPTFVAEYRLTKDAAGRAVVLMPSEAAR